MGASETCQFNVHFIRFNLSHEDYIFQRDGASLHNLIQATAYWTITVKQLDWEA